MNRLPTVAPPSPDAPRASSSSQVLSLHHTHTHIYHTLATLVRMDNRATLPTMTERVLSRDGRFKHEKKNDSLGSPRPAAYLRNGQISNGGFWRSRGQLHAPPAANRPTFVIFRWHDPVRINERSAFFLTSVLRLLSRATRSRHETPLATVLRLGMRSREVHGDTRIARFISRADGGRCLTQLFKSRSTFAVCRSSRAFRAEVARFER